MSVPSLIHTLLVGIIIVLIVVVFAMDQLTEMGIAGGVPYVVPVVTSLFLPGRRVLFVVATATTALTIIGLALSLTGGEPWTVMLNRSYAVLAIWSVTFVGVLRKGAEEELERSRDDLEVDATEQPQEIEKETIERNPLTAELSEDGELFGSLLAHSPDVVIVVNREGTILFASYGLINVFGYQPEELFDQSVETLIPESLRARHVEHRKAFANDLRGREMGANLDLRGRRKDGTEFPIEVSLAPLPADDQAEFRVMAIVRDVTDRDRTARMLSQAQRVAEMGAWEQNLVTGELYWSEETFRLFGLSELDHVTQQDYRKAIHPDDRERVQELFANALRNREPHDIEYRILWPDGTERTMHGQAEIVSDTSGNPLRVLGFVQDITDRRRLTTILSRAQEITHLGSWERNLVTHHLEWSDEVYRIFGLSPGEIVPSYSHFIDRVHPEDRTLVQESLDQAVRGDGLYEVDHRILLPDGAERIVHEQGEVAYDPFGSPIRLLGTVQDITDHRRIEERLRLLSSLRQQVAAAPDFESALKVAVEAICRETGWSYGEAWAPDEGGEHLRHIFSWSEANLEGGEFRRASATTTYRINEGIPGRVWASLAPEWTGDLTQLSRERFPRYDLAIGAGLRSVLGAPVLAGDDLSAVLLFFQSEARVVDEVTIETVAEVTAGLGLVLQRTKAQDALLMQTEELETLYKISSVAAWEGNPDTKLKSILEEILRISDATIAVLRTVDSTGDNFVTKVVVGPSAEEFETRPSVPANGTRAGQAFTEGRPIIDNDYASSPNVMPAWVRRGIQSVAIIPLEGSHRRLGIIAIGAKNAANFTPHRVELLSAISGDVSHILEKTLDEEELQRKNEELERSNQEKEVLLREVHHRVKNNLAVISGLLNLQAQQTVDDSARRALQDSQRRVQSMALVHEQLHLTNDAARIDFADYVRSLVRGLSMSYGASAVGISIGVDVEPLQLTVDEAIPAGLIIQELISNAFKHAFPDGSIGRIDVDVRSMPGETCVITVSDDGVGNWAKETAQRASSLGLSLVDNLSRQLGAELTHDTSSGTRTTLEFTMKPITATPSKEI